MTYWALNAIFLAVVAAVAVGALATRRAPRWVAVALTLGVVIVMTAVFDNVMIGVGLVGYDAAKISGAFIGIAPLEDFAYAIAAVVVLPSLWTLLAPRAGSSARAGSPGPAGSAARAGSSARAGRADRAASTQARGMSTEPTEGAPHA